MTLTEFLTGVANAIRAKKGTTAEIPAQNFASEIASIQTGTDTSDATATAGDILSGKTAYGASGKLTGTIASKTVSNVTASGATVTVPAGYYSSQVQKSVSTATQATPSISISSTGLITASATQSAGYVSSGTKSTTKQLTTQAAKTVTPKATSQTAVASGRYTTGAVTVAGDANLVPGNIAEGVSIFGVTGTFSGGLIETVSVTNNSDFSAYVVCLNGGSFTAGTVNGNTTQNNVVKGSFLVFPNVSSSYNYSGDCEFIGILSDYFGFTVGTVYQINGNCTFTRSGVGEN